MRSRRRSDKSGGGRASPTGSWSRLAPIAKHKKVRQRCRTFFFFSRFVFNFGCCCWLRWVVVMFRWPQGEMAKVTRCNNGGGHRGKCAGRACSLQPFCLNVCPFATVATRKLPTNNCTVLDISTLLHHPNIFVVPVVRHVLFVPSPPSRRGWGTGELAWCIR